MSNSFNGTKSQIKKSGSSVVLVFGETQQLNVGILIKNEVLPLKKFTTVVL